MLPVYLQVFVPTSCIRHGDIDCLGEVPCMSSDGIYWSPVIELDSGRIVNWANGVAASVCIKVRDNGRYLLLDANKSAIYSRDDEYVPDAYLVHSIEPGYGDYIQFDVCEDGKIFNYKKPHFNNNEWSKM